MQLPEWLSEIFKRTGPFENTVAQWLIALGVALLALVAMRLVKSVLAYRFRVLSERTTAEWPPVVHELIRKTKLWFLFVLSLFVGSLALTFPEKGSQVIVSLTIITLLLQAAVWGDALLSFAIARNVRLRMETDAQSVPTVTMLGFVAKLVLWVIVVLLALENVGVNVTALVAGLGIGGLAIALAAQNILGDLFGSLSIMFDKPFVLGDFIVVGDYMGSVEYIGVKSTRVRSLSGEQLVFSNRDLLESRIRNFKRMAERRILFSIGVTYDTPREKVAAIPGMIRETVEAQNDVRFDRAHFKQYGDSALIFEVVYYVRKPDYNIYMDIQQAINLAIYERMEQAGVEFAFPTQTLYVHTEPASGGEQAA